MTFPLQQSAAYQEAMAGYGAAYRWVLPITLSSGNAYEAHILTRKVLGLEINLLLRGPLSLNLSPGEAEEQQELAMTLRRRFTRRKGKLLFWLPPPGITEEILRQSGWWRFPRRSCTSWLDLTQTAETLRAKLRGNWRNQLKKAEATSLELRTTVKADHAHFIAALQQEQEQRKAKRYRFLPVDFPQRFAQAGGKVMLLEAILHNASVAQVIFLLHSPSATYFFSHTTEKGKTLNAGNWLLWRAALKLKERGIASLDLGGLEPQVPASVAHFKHGMAGSEERSGMWW